MERIYHAKEIILKERHQNKEIQHVVKKVLLEKKSRDRDEELSHKKNKKFTLLIEKNQHLSKKIE